ncbi:MAG: hypothetical protein JNM69_00825 [Archangium sp.]|nr:hypothetical protein [Archangium sp.]
MNDSTDLSQQLVDLRARLATLEAERSTLRRALKFAASGGLLAVLLGTVASAADGACPNGLPFCFAADTPASASEVNTNFAQLKEWLEAKVGVVGVGVRVQPGATITSVAPPPQATRGLFVSSSTTSPTEPILDVRHDNLTQGVGIGWNSIVATGSAATQDLQFVAKGAGQVISASNFSVGATTATCAIGPCFCPAGLFALTWTGTCSNAGVGVYSVAAVTNGSAQRGFDVQCISSNFGTTAPMRNLTVVCSRLVTP